LHFGRLRRDVRRGAKRLSALPDGATPVPGRRRSDSAEHSDPRGMSAFTEAETLLAIDVGSVNTRASLFDIVDGRYRLVATGRAASTAGAPLFDVSEGVRLALEQVQSVTGRRLVDESESLIMPASAGGGGVDVFVATASAGPRGAH